MMMNTSYWKTYSHIVTVFGQNDVQKDNNSKLNTEELDFFFDEIILK